MTLDEALAAAWNGNAIAFLGSGFSRGAVNLRNGGFKTAEDLRIRLNTAASAPSEGTLADAAEAYRNAFGDFALIEELTKEFSAKSVAEHHKIISTIPWRRIYTTNYDNVLEEAAKQTGTKLIPVTLKIDPYAARQDGVQYVHLNGAVEGLSPDDLDTTLKLTDTSYVTSSIAQSPWAITFRNDLRLADTVLYLGYSLFDLDVKRLIYEFPDLQKKSFFVLGEKPPTLTRQRIERYGELIELNADAIAARLPGLRPKSSASPTFRYEALREIQPESTGRPARDQDVFDLFELGSVQQPLIHESIASNGAYYLEREATSQALQLLEAGAIAVVLTSSLGNGKTLALERCTSGRRAGLSRFHSKRTKREGHTGIRTCCAVRNAYVAHR